MAEQDQIVFVMLGNERAYKSVAAGEGRRAFEEIAQRDPRWIEVDDSKWILRDHVLYAYVSAAEEGPLVASI